MTGLLRVGVVGAGMMGSAHARMLHEDIAGVEVVAVHDADAARARAVASSVGAEPASTALDLVAGVDAVVVASPDATHAELVSACLEAGRPVLCEKPLALSTAESARLVQQEVDLGRRLVQVGFMRRYDPGLVAVRDAVRRGDLGTVRLVHCVHRNASSVTSTSDANLVTGSMIHELDQIRWLLSEDLADISIVSPVRDGFRDPQLATVTTRSGVLVTVEVFVNASYGYDVRCEVVGTQGTATAAAEASVRWRRAGAETSAVPADFVARFAEAYRLELTDWVGQAVSGRSGGASVWDGHLANLAAAAGIEALTTGRRVSVESPQTPALYAD